MRESEIEKYLVSAVKRTGGIAVKNAVTYLAGFPDRTILFDGGKCVFAELKAPGKNRRRCNVNGRMRCVRWAFAYT